MESNNDLVQKSAKDFVSFLNKAVTPFHAVEECAFRLQNSGFEELDETGHWKLSPGKKYYVTKNHSTIIAFAVGAKYHAGNGFSIVVGHTDSPSLRVKPISKIQAEKFLQVGVTTYGGGLWRTWFDRDLSIAGAVVFKTEDAIVHKLVKIDRAVLNIPSLAIHFCNAGERAKFDCNNEINLRPILASFAAEKLNKLSKNTTKDDKPNGDGKTSAESIGVTNDHHPLLLEAISKAADCDPHNILDLDLYLYDNQKAVISGLLNEFIAGQRLDNLVGTYTSITGLLDSLESDDALDDEENVRMAACYDNEECGSDSAQGAASAFTEWVLRRISAGGHQTAFEEAIAKSFLISTDQAHAAHPNYRDKYEENHRPELHGGVVVKINVNQRYATTSTTHAILKSIANTANVPMQKYVTRNDMPCGSTVGPIMATRLGIRTIDVGCAQLAMHSIRELTCTSSISQAVSLFTAFYQCLPRVLKMLA